MLQQLTILIPHRTDKNRGPKFSPILPATMNFRIGIRAAFKSGAHLRYYVAGGPPSQQGVKTLTKNLGPIKAGQRKKTVIRKHDRVSGILCIGKHHRHPGRFSRDYKRPQVFSMVLNVGFCDYLLFWFALDFQHMANLVELQCESN